MVWLVTIIKVGDQDDRGACYKDPQSRSQLCVSTGHCLEKLVLIDPLDTAELT